MVLLRDCCLCTNCPSMGSVNDFERSLTLAAMPVLAVEKIASLFGKAPRSYAYDRAGHSERNIDRLREIGVRDVGLAPGATRRGKWRGL